MNREKGLTFYFEFGEKVGSDERELMEGLGGTL